MATVRMFPLRELAPLTPFNATGAGTANYSGRTYHARPFELVDVDVRDSGFLAGNGWCAVVNSGPRRERPTRRRLGHFYDEVQIGTVYLDTDVRAVLVWTGHDWRDVLNGEPAP